MKTPAIISAGLTTSNYRVIAVSVRPVLAEKTRDDGAGEYDE